jgi:hypothetical protein
MRRFAMLAALLAAAGVVYAAGFAVTVTVALSESQVKALRWHLNRDDPGAVSDKDIQAEFLRHVDARVGRAMSEYMAFYEARLSQSARISAIEAAAPEAAAIPVTPEAQPKPKPTPEEVKEPVGEVEP